ncbi:replicative DNA helicase [Myroides odoratimimus]|uniref:replicative DNA helicase n=1 Tax=Myroides odoratimimus TaxID=76832 RepID=UPI0020969F68|nr:replicative DNA helicase [Myroides odoratimimus]MCO7721954.1 replicative DNA helicase [Myroides odoratimimus]
MKKEIKGLVPPHSKDIEEAVLGSMINDKKSLDEAMQVVKDSSVFYVQENVDVFEAIQMLYANSLPVDLLSVCQQLRVNGKNHDAFVVGLAQQYVSSAHIDYHCRLLLQKKLRRMIVSFNSRMNAAAMDETNDVFDLLSRWNKEFDTVTELITAGKSSVTLAESLQDLSKRLEFISKSTGESKITGVLTGFKRIDAYTSGYQEGDLVILAARPGMGKTAKALKTVVENAKAGNAVGVISLEMPIQQLASRIVSIDTNFHLGQLMKTGFDKPEYWDTFNYHVGRMEKYPVFMKDSGVNDISDIVIEARSWKRKHDIKLLVVDYLQLVSDRTKGNNREQEISSVSRRMKLLAKELGIPIILLSQLSRKVEDRGGLKRPLLSDLRESGSIEQDADIVEFIYRPEYYNIDLSNPEFERMTGQGGDTEIIFAKYRAGSIGTTFLKWIGDKTKFVDPTDSNENVIKLPEVSVYNNPNQLVGNLPNASDVFGDDNPF